MERVVSEEICRAADPDRDLQLAAVIVEALLDGVAPHIRAKLASMRLCCTVLRRSPGPDFVLHDKDMRIYAVFENKVFAPANAMSYPRFEDFNRFSDELATSLARRPRDDEAVPDGPWSSSRVGPLLWQIDYYRCNSSWISGFELHDATEVSWVMFDYRGRSAADVFPGAHTAHIWQTTSYAGFARRLWLGYEQSVAGGQEERAAALRDLLRIAAT